MDFSLEIFPEDVGGLVKALDKLQRSIKKTLNTAFSFNTSNTFELLGMPTFPLVLTPKLKGPVKHVLLTYCRNESDDLAPAAGVFVDWIPDGGKVFIRGISGLTSGKIYTLRFLVFD